MAISYEGILDQRLRARFHVQVELTDVPSDFPTPAAIWVEGRVVRIFRGDSSLAMGDKLTFDINVCRRGDVIPCGPSYTLYEKFVSGRYVEAFLNGFPPHVQSSSYMILSAPTRRPRLESARVKRTWFEWLTCTLLGSRSKCGVEILNDTMGVDFGPYLSDRLKTIRQNWYKLIPEVARRPIMRKGNVAIEFKIMPDGSVADMELVHTSKDVSLDREAWGGIAASNPFPPLPSEFKGQFLALRISFTYNADPFDSRNTIGAVG